ncbi:MAG: Uma2 family endonuclease [Actinomycetota bacterium]|nr:Uma2 family endonuclease [Actinomycetota bacterium]
MATDLARSRPLTAEDLYDLPPDDNRYELVEGALRTMPPPGFEHGYLTAKVAANLLAFVDEHLLGQVVAGDPGFVLARGPDTVLAPDVAFVRADRLPAPEHRHRFAELAPDLVVEVVSPSDRPGEVTEKAVRWVEAGVRLTWMVHPDQRMVAVYQPGAAVRLVHEDGELDGGDVLPGFRLAVADLFR